MTNTLQPNPVDTRKLALADWVTINTPTRWHPILLQGLDSDAGFRRYFRFKQDADQAIHWLAVDAPPDSEDSYQFIAIAECIRSQGLSSPTILAADPAQGFLLVEDMGDELLFRILNPTNADRLYQQAMDALLRLQQIPDDPSLIPRYDRAQLRRELEIFNDWFVVKLLDHRPSQQEREMLDDLFILLENSALSQPQGFVHRDFHSRNLLLRDDDEIGIIDFQGALWGGVTYDLVSLLRDCYLHWPPEKVIDWALYYYQHATASQRIPAVSEEEFLRWFDWLGLQRHIKVLGIFARLLLRDDKPAYAQDLPLVIRYVLEVTSRYPALQPFAKWFHETLLPLAEQQFWYSDYRIAGDRK